MLCLHWKKHVKYTNFTFNSIIFVEGLLPIFTWPKPSISKEASILLYLDKMNNIILLIDIKLFYISSSFDLISVLRKWRRTVLHNLVCHNSFFVLIGLLFYNIHKNMLKSCQLYIRGDELILYWCTFIYAFVWYMFFIQFYHQAH